MKYLDANELKEIELRILKEIDAICEAQKIRYSLCAGTLLGAVRHNGFIPWDDDIDIMLPRPDFDRFIEYCKKNITTFKIVSCETSKGYADIMAKAYDPTTSIRENSRNAILFDIGVWIDIFPVDGIGNTKDEAVRSFRSTALLRGLLIARNWNVYRRSTSHSWRTEPIRFILFILSRFIPSHQIIRKIKSKYSSLTFETQNFVGCLYGAYREREILPREVFAEYDRMQFEDSEYCCIRAYDRYLCSLYGDYMRLPPESKRHTHHDFDAWYKNCCSIKHDEA